MKHLLILAVVAISTFAMADTIFLNSAGGTITYQPSVPSLYGNETGFSFAVTGDPPPGAGKFHSGWLTVDTSTLYATGTLKNIFFNSKTGLLQGVFQGTVTMNGQRTSVYHGIFYESVNLRGSSLNGGYMVFGNVPEPPTFWLLATGVLILAGRHLLREANRG
jgi:hypothetical protein